MKHIVAINQQGEENTEDREDINKQEVMNKIQGIGINKQRVGKKELGA